jgi:hypothetical protein
LVQRRDALFRTAARAQGRRFLIAALSAAAKGDFALADGYADVLIRLQSMGLGRAYALAARLASNRVGHRMLSTAAQIRRARGRRAAASVRREAAQT